MAKKKKRFNLERELEEIFGTAAAVIAAGVIKKMIVGEEKPRERKGRGEYIPFEEVK